MDFDETWYAWSTQVSLQVLLFFGQIRPGADPGRGQNRSRGSPFSKNFFFRPEGYSNKPNASQWSRIFIYLLRWKRGGVALVHVYAWEHIVSFNFRIAWWIFAKLGRDKVLMIPHICIEVLANSAQVWIKNRWRGSPSPKNFFLRPEGYSNKLNAVAII